MFVISKTRWETFGEYALKRAMFQRGFVARYENIDALSNQNGDSYESFHTIHERKMMRKQMMAVFTVWD